MNTSDITNYVQKMEQLIQMQQIELDKTRNLLGRALDANRGSIEVMRKDFDIPDNVNFNIINESDNSISIHMPVTVYGMKSMYECIAELKKELNL